ncbi:MAG: LamG domain-containing protein, partial [Gammaproteobacteria bacterium]
VQLPWGGDNFDLSHLNADGLTLLQRALEWGAGASGAAPQTILFVVPDATALTAQDAAKKVLMESWGFSVALITAADSQANFDAAVASADVAYISEEAISSDTNTKLRDATIGVVNEETALTDEFGIAGVRTGYTGTDIEVVDTSHYITSVFASGPLTIASAATALNRLTGSLAPGLDALAETTGDPELAAIETGWALYDSGTAAGRRVQLPWGSDAFDINLLTADGQTLMRRAIEWGAGVGAATAPLAHWKFDEGSGPTAFDAVGGNDATLNGGSSWTTGTINGALDFDGSGDYVTTNNNFTPPPVGTVTFWMQVSGSPASHGRILGLHDTWEIRHVTTGTPDGIPYGLVFDLGLSGVNTEFVTTTTIDTPGQWYHIAAAYDTTNDAYAVYIDGVPHKSGTYPSTLSVPAANPLSLGTRTGSTNYFDGVLDDVRVYDQFLSAAEIAALAAGGGGGGGGGGSPTIVEVRVATGNDDAEERVSNGNVNLTSSDLELIADGANAQLVGMRFTGVAVPNGATITNAWIQFQVDETNTGATNVNIQGETSDSALQFTTGNSNISSRGRTTASIPWAPVSWTTVGEAGPDQQTPDISAAIQEIVSRPGWASGNDMVIIITGSGERTAEAYNGDAAGAPLLHIEY